MKEVADEIRLAGNEAAHGDILYEPISIADAKEIVELLDAMLMRIYQEPAKVARVRASRLARHGKPQALEELREDSAEWAGSHQDFWRRTWGAGSLTSRSPDLGE